MIDRYSREEMASKWTYQAKYQAWLDVEKAVVKAWAKLGKIPQDDADKIVKNATFSVERIEEIEAVLNMTLLHLTQVFQKALVKSQDGSTMG